MSGGTIHNERFHGPEKRQDKIDPGNILALPGSIPIRPDGMPAGGVGAFYSAFIRMPSLWAENSGAYMHWNVVMPFEKSPAWLTRRSYSNT